MAGTHDLTHASYLFSSRSCGWLEEEYDDDMVVNVKLSLVGLIVWLLFINSTIRLFHDIPDVEWECMIFYE